MANVNLRTRPAKFQAVTALLFTTLLPLAPTPNPEVDAGWIPGKVKVENGDPAPVQGGGEAEQPIGSGSTVGDTSNDSNQSGITYTYERVCLQGVGSFLDPSVCVDMNAQCDDEPGGALVEWIAIDSSTNPPTETQTGERSCLYPGQPAPEPPGGGEVAEPEVVITLEDFQSQPIIAAEIVSEPKNFGLLGGHNNVWANVEEQEFNFETLGDEVRIRAWPVEYDWNYGDGTSKITTTAGNSVPEEEWLMVETPTSHVYEETGDYNLVLTTRFNGDYSVNGGPWIPIAGQAEVQSEAHLMSIWRSDNRLVDGTCKDNPSAWGCD